MLKKHRTKKAYFSISEVAIIGIDEETINNEIINFM